MILLSLFRVGVCVLLLAGCCNSQQDVFPGLMSIINSIMNLTGGSFLDVVISFLQIIRNGTSIFNQTSIEPIEQLIIVEPTANLGTFMSPLPGRPDVVQVEADILLPMHEYRALHKRKTLGFLEDVILQQMYQSSKPKNSLQTLFGSLLRKGQQRAKRATLTQGEDGGDVTKYRTRRQYRRKRATLPQGEDGGDFTKYRTRRQYRRKRAAIRDEDKRWPNGIVHVSLESAIFSPTDKQNIAEAMNAISSKTCICFKAINKYQATRQQIPHLRLVNSNGCASYVGLHLRHQNGTLSQDLFLHPDCRKKRVVIHELLHTLGLHHEQSRPDRDDYVTINLANVAANKRDYFERYENGKINTLGIPYDYNSIMHFSNKAFSKDNRHYTIVPVAANRKKYLNTIGRVNDMSAGDAAVINAMYKCSKYHQPYMCEQYPYTALMFPM